MDIPVKKILSTPPPGPVKRVYIILGQFISTNGWCHYQVFTMTYLKKMYRVYETGER